MFLGTCVAVFDADRLLLTKREDFEVWCMPGGACEPGESVAAAAVREVKEETGLDVALTRLVGVYFRPQPRSAGGMHVASFAARIVSGLLAPQAEEVLEARWFARSDVPHDLLWGHRQRIADAFDGATGLVCTQDVDWPFDASLSRADIYALRDRSGLSRLEFYRRHFGSAPARATVEVPGEPST